MAPGHEALTGETAPADGDGAYTRPRERRVVLLVVIGLTLAAVSGRAIELMGEGEDPTSFRALSHWWLITASGVSLAALWRGHPRFAACTYTAALIATIATVTAWTPSEQSVGVLSVMWVPVAISGVLLGSRAVLATTFLLLGALGLAFLRNDAGYTVGPADYAVLLRVTAMSVMGAGAVVGLLIRTRNAAIRSTALRGQRLAAAREELESHNRALAQAMAAREEIEVQLSQAQRLESLGRLSAGIAHDFNNLLTAIQGNVEILESHPLVRDHCPVRGPVAEIREASTRATALTTQLLAFARGRRAAPRETPIGDAVSGFMPLCRSLLGDAIETDLRLRGAVGTAAIEQGELEQVLLNLTINARDAMPEGGAFTLTVERIAGDSAAPGVPASGPWIRIVASDTGFGMAEDVLENVFDPFFTTKPVGEGTGLGLATCYGIVTKAGGSIRVQSAEHEGTTFTIDLPWAGDVSGHIAEFVPDINPAEVEVWVVDDEPAVGELAARLLAGMGHPTRTFVSGWGLLAAIEQGEALPTVVLSDVRMPGLSGHELARRLRRDTPQLGVVLMSGYTDSADVATLRGIVAKPFTGSTLHHAVAMAAVGGGGTIDATAVGGASSPATPPLGLERHEEPPAAPPPA